MTPFQIVLLIVLGILVLGTIASLADAVIAAVQWRNKE